ncbi:MAG: nucleoside triphosphate pyrophosphohydrolase [Gammaproteobacteria bacterium]|nr:MAG: nucleoside triphosphate pyrophosphohydrolase [Gammaproteobacteria bacterium]
MDDIYKLLEIMAALRDPLRGCPWDRAQDFRSIAPYTIEEAYEVADAIDRGDLGALREELGDLLLQVVFHAQMASEQGAFDFADVVAGINAKLRRRHPHVFGAEQVATAGEQSLAWEAQKAEERAAAGATGTLDGVSQALPALRRACKLGQRAARVGFDWPDAGGPRQKLLEELAEVDAAAAGEDRARLAEEVGDLLFAAANLARKLGVEPEEALRQANRKFSRRFAAVEQSVRASGRPFADFSLQELDALWELAKG